MCEVTRKGSQMRSTIIALLAIIALSVSGCQPESKPIPDDAFRVTIIEMAKYDDLIAANLRLEFMGKRTVSISRKGGGASTSSSITVDPSTNRDSHGIGVVDVPFVATLTEVPDSTNRLKWLVGLNERRGNVLGTRAGGGPLSVAVEAERLGDILGLSISEGLYPVGQDVTIGTFQDQPIVLRVERGV